MTDGALEPFIGLPPSPGKVGYSYDGGVVTYYIGKNYNDVCSKEHTNVYYDVTFGGTPHTIPMKIYGDAQYGFANRSVTIFEGMPQAGAILTTNPSLEIGLDQQFKDKPADIDLYINVQFNSLGSFSQDSTYFAEHIVSLKVRGLYSKDL
jgi:hypothetical protein